MCYVHTCNFCLIAFKSCRLDHNFATKHPLHKKIFTNFEKPS